ncbi:MAG: undecaprenyldiphospho-muramoylpentapeptide beta-N-acetylglucosaminyltransferase [Clostridiales bacterium]|nr:undecaprenyldiphospho-muramoylpentapeptide beta-N-acetylglucosaminyltransferase [Clostridiales bacterium]
MTRVIVTGGGTGGHIYPALAIADGIKKRWPDTDVRYIGGRGGMESRIVPQAGYPFWGISAEGWQGRRIRSLATALKVDLSGSREAEGIIRAFQPEAVIGTGGFVCLPVGLAAAKKRIPIYLHEQNAMPGLTNRLMSVWAKKIMVSFEESVHRFPHLSGRKAVVTGLPVRDSIIQADAEEGYAFFQLDPNKKTILAVGGSLGAERINRAMLQVVGQLYRNHDVQVIFATGQRDFQHVTEELDAAGIQWDTSAGAQSNIRVLTYIDRMDLAYAAADIFVGRSGASTMAEVTLSRLPAILVPYPHATENHQAHNAISLADKGGAILLEDSGLNGNVLLTSLLELLADDHRRAAMAECSYKASYGRALEDILDVLSEAIS